MISGVKLRFARAPSGSVAYSGWIATIRVRSSCACAGCRSCAAMAIFAISPGTYSFVVIRDAAARAVSEIVLHVGRQEEEG